ncbi:MAG: cyclic nucleotide-binding domain-containing protein [Acidobacteriota bacterium]|nr:cyclic nucleotide-binding domain-containing protein [Acidobacteriota bacterium]
MSELAHIETIVFLQSVDLFSFCKAEEVLRVAAITQERRFAAGEKIFRRDDLADRIYCVVRGEIELDSSSAGSNDSEEAQNGERMGPLSTFGVLEILSGKLRTTSASALTDTLLLVLEAEDFFDLLSNNIEIVKALFRYVVRELHEGQETMG